MAKQGLNGQFYRVSVSSPTKPSCHSKIQSSRQFFTDLKCVMSVSSPMLGMMVQVQTIHHGGEIGTMRTSSIVEASRGPRPGSWRAETANRLAKVSQMPWSHLRWPSSCANTACCGALAHSQTHPWLSARLGVYEFVTRFAEVMKNIQDRVVVRQPRTVT
eukprot:6177768-Pyramimonas_sp.AAC.1